MSSDRYETRWREWGRHVFAVAIVISLTALAVANIAMRGQWHEVEDGVYWGDRVEGVTAVEVAQGSAADRAGIKQGDVLLAINNRPVQSRNEVHESQHQAHEGTRVRYSLGRL